MTRAETISLALDAGFNPMTSEEMDTFEAFAKLVAAKEREACAKVLEDASKTGKIISCMSAAAAIRARGEALAKQEQGEPEPVGQLLEDAFGRGQVMWFNKPKDESMLYTTPQPKQEQGEQDCVGWFGYDTGLRLWFEANKGDDGAIPLYKARSAT